MSEQKEQPRRCAVDGCRAWAIPGQPYCSPHYRQWQENLRTGEPDPEPRLVGRHRRLCAARSCRHLAAANSIYCPAHAEQVTADEKDTQAVADAFAALLAQLESTPPSALEAVVREQTLLDSARRILLAHAQIASRDGWRTISAMSFTRLWLSSTAAANDLSKSRFLMEAAEGRGLDPLLESVYARIDALPPAAQPPLPGLGNGVPCQRLDAPEESLAEWMLEAVQRIGVCLAAEALRSAAAQAGAPAPYAHDLGTLAEGLYSGRVESPEPAALADRLATLAQILTPDVVAERPPDLAAIRAHLEGARHG